MLPDNPCETVQGAETLTSQSSSHHQKLFKYIAKTGHFHNTFRDLPELAEDERNERARR
jgi:hypothetical protein